MTKPLPESPAIQPPPDFLHAAREYGIKFDDGDLDRLAAFIYLLLETNRQFNLTAITDPNTVWMRHIYDGLTLLPYILQSEATCVADVGSGGGLPGIPLAITCPEVEFTLLEATGKKSVFLEECIRTLNLKNVSVVCERSETLGRNAEQFREQFDLVTARAVGRLNVLLELTSPLVRVGGTILAIKGEKAPEEVEQARTALHRLHCAVVDIHRTDTGSIVVIEKRRATPKMYPRRPGEPKRNPL